MQRAFRLAAAGAAAVAIVALARAATLDAGTLAERTIYVTVMDDNGAPVPDMKASEFAVKEDGADRVITSVGRATEPLHYAVLVDTSPRATQYISDIRQALVEFCKLLLSADPNTKFAIMEFGGAGVLRQDFTSDLSAIDGVIGKLLPRQSEPVLNEALVEISKKLAGMPAGTRRVIVTLNMEPTPEGSNLHPKIVAEEVRKSGAALWSLALQEGNRRDANREAMLKGLTANAGGRWVPLQSPTTQLSPFLRSVAANSFSQYAVTYTQPDGAPPPKVTDVAISRAGAVALSIKWSSQ